MIQSHHIQLWKEVPVHLEVNEGLEALEAVQERVCQPYLLTTPYQNATLRFCGTKSAALLLFVVLDMQSFYY